MSSDGGPSHPELLEIRQCGNLLDALVLEAAVELAKEIAEGEPPQGAEGRQVTHLGVLIVVKSRMANPHGLREMEFLDVPELAESLQVGRLHVRSDEVQDFQLEIPAGKLIHRPDGLPLSGQNDRSTGSQGPFSNPSIGRSSEQ